MNIGEISFFQDSTTGQIYPGKEKKTHQKNRREFLEEPFCLDLLYCLIDCVKADLGKVTSTKMSKEKTMAFYNQKVKGHLHCDITMFCQNVCGRNSTPWLRHRRGDRDHIHLVRYWIDWMEAAIFTLSSSTSLGFCWCWLLLHSVTKIRRYIQSETYNQSSSSLNCLNCVFLAPGESQVNHFKLCSVCTEKHKAFYILYTACFIVKGSLWDFSCVGLSDWFKRSKPVGNHVQSFTKM